MSVQIGRGAKALSDLSDPPTIPDLNVPAVRSLGPDEVGPQRCVHRAPIVGFRSSGGRIVERMIGGGKLLSVMAHQVRHDYPDTALLVVEHDRLPAGLANAQLERAVGILIVEGHAFQAACTLYRQ